MVGGLNLMPLVVVAGGFGATMPGTGVAPGFTIVLGGAGGEE
jgi:hypothetical protein